jgi:hypothetical protein
VASGGGAEGQFIVGLGQDGPPAPAKESGTGRVLPGVPVQVRARLEFTDGHGAAGTRPFIEHERPTMAMSLNQIAIIVESAEASVAFYQDLFGVPRVGGTVFKGKVPAKVQALPDPNFVANWHMDDHDYFQLELFEYRSPKSKPYARLRKPWGIGYSRISR